VETQADGFKPPYMSFQTFWHFLADLSAKPLPRKLDRSIMVSKSGTDQNNLMSTLEAFGFINADGVVQEDLDRFVETEPEGRKKILAALLQKFYAPPLKISADNGSPAGLNEAFRDDLSMLASDTRRKAITFFLHAAREAELPLSPHFPKTRAGSGNPGAPKAKRSRRKPNGGVDQQQQTPPAPHTADGAGETVVVDLGAAGRVVVNVNVRWLQLEETTFLALRKAVNDMKSLAAETPAQQDADSGPDDSTKEG
jgi:hypothetical protein